MSGPSVKISLRSSSGKCIRTSLAAFSLREKELSKRTTSFCIRLFPVSLDRRRRGIDRCG